MNSQVTLTQVSPNPLAFQIASKVHISEGVLGWAYFLDISHD